jgi:membrane protein YqaA with SNARE-associated domain
LSWLNQIALWVQHSLLPWGSWGLALAAVADSSVVPFPSGVDLWMITLCVQNPYRAPLYAVVASIGSVAGATALAFAVSKGEEAFLARKVPPEKLEQARRKIEQSGFWALVAGGILPPPTPFKLFVIAAGLLRYPLGKFTAALFIGRMIRYSLEGFLAVRYGRKAWQLLLRAGPWAFVAAASAAILALLIYQSRRRKMSDSPR